MMIYLSTSGNSKSTDTSNLLNKYTKEMEEHYIERTARHIRNVQEVGKTVLPYFRTQLETDQLIERLGKHDASKYSDREYKPYIFLSWFHKQNNAGLDYVYPPGVEQLVRKATLTHIKRNKHHLEAHNSATQMSDIDLAEMVADWGGMSLELGTSLKE